MFSQKGGNIFLIQKQESSDKKNIKMFYENKIYSLVCLFLSVFLSVANWVFSGTKNVQVHTFRDCFSFFYHWRRNSPETYGLDNIFSKQTGIADDFPKTFF